MKKTFSFLLVAMLGLFLFSCSDRTHEDNDTYSVVYDIKGVNFEHNENGYHISRTFNKPLYDSDAVLIYRQNGNSNGTPVWQQIPKTIFVANNQEVDYDFDFTKNDIMIYAGGNYNLSTTPQYINNQTFRVVIVPASFGKSKINTSDYETVIKQLKINDSQVENL